ncbi:unnamed protein product [Larinioides sclopetarius]|uniref:Uncharacterized protein n=1 Tax=Larinioides sclopetarius TaxID=280406 RepID=A0AAV2BM42_9ARAC
MKLETNMRIVKDWMCCIRIVEECGNGGYERGKVELHFEELGCMYPYPQLILDMGEIFFKDSNEVSYSMTFLDRSRSSDHNSVEVID